MIVFLLILTLISIKPYIHQAFPYTHDGENHLARFANYKIALKEGQFPPRFAPNLLNHYGYPVFNYNYPLANILSVPFSVLKINYELTFKILVFCFVLAGLYGAHIWLRALKFPKQARLFALTGFATTPYLITALSFRGNIGEIMAFSLLPWLFYWIEKPSPSYKKNGFLFFLQTLTLLLFLLSHNIAVLFGIPLLLLYSVYKYRTAVVKQTTLIISALVATTASLWFWLPAIFEKNLVILDNANLSQGFSDHFPTFHQLLFSPLEFGFSKIGSVDSLSFQMGFVQVLAVLIGTVYLLRNRMNRYLKFILTIVYFLFLLQLPFTQPLWDLIPLANYIQFPWRLGLFLGIFILPLLAFVFRTGNTIIKTLLISVMIIQLLVTFQVKPADYFHKTIVDYDAFSQTTSTANENLPKDFTYQDFADWQPTATIIDGQGTVKVAVWRGSNRTYQLSLDSPATIVEPTARFAGWETTVTNLSTGESMLIDYDLSEASKGRLAYQLPAGTFDVVTQFTQNTLPRIIGNTLSSFSLVSLLLLSTYSIWSKYLPKRKNV